ncbi:E3 Ubiquitin ligase family protein [Raphanus sativus]|uniref:RING-type E3 ubiquitin transferase n=1 Tax=Raphanus sativus TaxID=3726 RepID=A0A6J0KW78_RAPSA|nr:E3 ubiquitin-protein ligase SPL2 [Raphanus sativus]KAJ4882036.1 E3 Ubiquitin ligase family protein [Raphanus sativus]
MSSADRAVLSLLTDIFLSFDGAILGVTLAFGAVHAASKYASTSAALSKIKDAPEVSVSDLRSLIPPSDDESSHVNQRVVVVRGAVEPKVTGDGSHKNNNNNNVLISQETGEKALIIHRTQTYMYSGWKSLFLNGHRLLLERSMPKQGADFMRMVPFVIVDKNQRSQSSFLLVNMDGARQPLPLTTVYNRLQPISSSPYAFLQALFFPEYPAGVLHVEKILPPGRDLTAVGICRFNNGVPEIKSCQDLPYFLSDMTKDKMIVDLTETTSVLFWGGVILGCLSVGILGFAAVRAWNRWKLRNHQRDRRRPDQHMVDDDTEEDADEIPDGELCVICVTRRRIPAFIPCGHVVCCRYCALTVERRSNPKCPVCLQSIRGSMRIYYS